MTSIRPASFYTRPATQEKAPTPHALFETLWAQEGKASLAINPSELPGANAQAAYTKAIPEFGASVFTEKFAYRGHDWYVIIGRIDGNHDHYQFFSADDHDAGSYTAKL